MLLENKVAAIYGGGGPIGGAVARAFAREGAEVYLAGRTRSRLETVAHAIHTQGGRAHIEVIDAQDKTAVDDFVDGIVAQRGRLDISFNVIGYGDIQKPLQELCADEFMQPIVNAMRTHFLTTQAAARHMTEREAGVILAFGGSGPQTLPGLGGFKVALDALEGLRRQWACELGQYGIRVLTLKTGGIPETIPSGSSLAEEIGESIRRATLLNRAATLADVGNVAAFVASDLAKSMTSTEVNISCGAMVD